MSARVEILCSLHVKLVDRGRRFLKILPFFSTDFQSTNVTYLTTVFSKVMLNLRRPVKFDFDVISEFKIITLYMPISLFFV